jgi:hypothetical protein
LDVVDRAGEYLPGRAGRSLPEILDQRLRYGVAEQAEQRYQHDQHRKDREHSVIRQGSRQVP